MSGTIIVGGVAIFLLVCISIGLYMARNIDGDSVNYIVAGRGLILPIVAATLMAQSLDANATLGSTDLSAEFGFWAGAALPVGLAACLIICGLFFAKPLNRMNLMTLPDFFREKYGRSVEIFASLVTSLSFTILLAGNLVAGGFLFQTFLGTTYTTGIVILGVIILLYTLTGGLYAVAYTDIIQAGVAFVGSVGLLMWVGLNYGLIIPEGMGPGATEQLTDPEAGESSTGPRLWHLRLEILSHSISTNGFSRLTRRKRHKKPASVPQSGRSSLAFRFHLLHFRFPKSSHKPALKPATRRFCTR